MSDAVFDKVLAREGAKPSDVLPDTARDERRACGACGHPQKYHRGEGCSVYACPCREYVYSTAFVAMEYSGDPMPKWVADGARVKVKATAHTRRYGFSTRGGSSSADDRAWPGEVGVIERSEGVGLWDWRVAFARGRRARLDARALEDLVRVKG
ncbi:MAG: hypothetical protein Q8S13_02720 [Dehalococcoidia bacterium]|nr:hypothetical protein [Dehalococcoidia bacterium]